MPALHRLCSLAALSLVLLCLQANFVLAGGGSSTRRNRPSGRNAAGTSRQGRYRGAIPPPERVPQVPIAPRLPEGMLFTQHESPVLAQWTQTLPGYIQRLGFEGSTATVHEGNPRELQKYEKALLTQMRSDQTRKQFIPLLNQNGLKTYAMPIQPLARGAWPRALGEYAGQRGVQKAFLFSVYDSNPAVAHARGIQAYGIVRITNAARLHQPSEQARQIMHTLPEMLHL
ncbi:hypothetical protein PSEUBRA_003297 [Kalmanozyma brasiliensis GHG001]|uniref:uncharacterized protein n=1 Tax=Kalmanozyma brasiliensis (strain GHG001) TaxID=1365824 RepID=UPI00286814FA|nr:uncharacterized protein PSEUBRA_003297 [Kalmanozyma brasiliensis GHG001]KAF6767217.1 hypothetical protein PSEUBRA_003297 [Kalmanozyma brasiliensis GHG001]